jgi:protein phosphatase 2C family protein 2/3
MTSQAVIDFVILGICKQKPLTLICEEMADNCLADNVANGVGCDNMTVVICALLMGDSEEEWRRKIVETHGATIEARSPPRLNQISPITAVNEISQ